MAFTRKLQIGRLKDKYVNFDSSIPLAHLKTAILEQTGIDPENCKLVMGGKNLFENYTLLRMSVEEVERLCGTMFGSSGARIVYESPLTSNVQEVKSLPLSENKTSTSAPATSEKKDSALVKIGSFGTNTNNTIQSPRKKSWLEQLINSSNNDDSPPAYRGKSK